MDPPGEIIWLAAVHPHRYQSTSLNLWRSIGNIKFYYFSWGQLHLRVTWGEHFRVAPDRVRTPPPVTPAPIISRGETQYFISVCCCEAPCWRTDISWNLRTKSWVLIFSCRPLQSTALFAVLSLHLAAPTSAIFILVCSQFPSETGRRIRPGRPGLCLPSSPLAAMFS